MTIEIHDVTTGDAQGWRVLEKQHEHNGALYWDVHASRAGVARCLETLLPADLDEKREGLSHGQLRAVAVARAREIVLSAGHLVEPWAGYRTYDIVRGGKAVHRVGACESPEDALEHYRETNGAASDATAVLVVAETAG